VPCTNYNV